jgi:hypothetical protein
MSPGLQSIYLQLISRVKHKAPANSAAGIEATPGCRTDHRSGEAKSRQARAANAGDVRQAVLYAHGSKRLGYRSGSRRLLRAIVRLMLLAAFFFCMAVWMVRASMRAALFVAAF